MPRRITTSFIVLTLLAVSLAPLSVATASAASAVASLAARDDVEYVSPDRAVKASLDVTRESVGASLVQAGTSGVKGLTGKGVGIAVIDSGISARHPDFMNKKRSRVVASVNFTTPGSGPDGDGILISD